MSKGLGKVQLEVIRMVGKYPISGATYRHIRVMAGLSPQTLSRAIANLLRAEYLRLNEEDWFGNGEKRRFYTLTSKGCRAFADKC